MIGYQMAGSGAPTSPVGAHELSPELQDRLKQTLGSYEELQLLLFARKHPAPWAAEDAARRLHLAHPALEEAIECLVTAGFLVATGEGTNGERSFFYRPVSPGLAELTDELAETLDHNPLHVLDLMNRHALERLRTSAMRTFAGAFVLGRKKDG